MSAQSLTVRPALSTFTSTLGYLTRPLQVLRSYQRSDLRADLIAGLTVGFILLPQSLVFAVMAGLPPQMGIYSAIVAAIVGALWGSSSHLQTGPTNTSSLLVLSTLVPIAVIGSPEYIAAAGVLAVLVGLLRLGLGLLRLGLLVNFVSDSVVVGFTSGAGLLIIISQLRALLRLSFPDSAELTFTLRNIFGHAPETHLPSLAIGLGTVVVILLLQRINRKLPGPLLAILLSSAVVAVLNLTEKGVKVIGAMQGGLPPLAKLPLFNLELIGQLSFGALAIAAIGLVEAMSITRSLSAQTRQRSDANQEFVGQGMASALAGLFSGYACSGSFNRSVALLQSGGRTAIASTMAGVFVLIASSLLTFVMAAIPLPALAGVLMVNAASMINAGEMLRIWRSVRVEGLIMLITFLGTLLLPLHFAVLTGILMSLAYYLLRTSFPRVLSVLPDEEFKHLIHQPDKPQCPQLAVIEILGDLYFGAVNHVEDTILANKIANPDQRYLLLRMQNVQHLDISGIHMLESVVEAYRSSGGDVYLVKVRPDVMERMQATDFVDLLGADHYLDEDGAIAHIFYRVLDPAICIYECEVRAFSECQNLPRPTYQVDIPFRFASPAHGFATVSAEALHAELRGISPPQVLDVRESREFRRGHIPQARNIPLPRLLEQPPVLSADADLVCVSRSARRSRLAVEFLYGQGYTRLRVLDGGMVAWEAAALLEAIEDFS